jgi:hypothetical protein
MGTLRAMKTLLPLLGTLVISPTAFAHVLLVDPEPRNDNSGYTNAPCGFTDPDEGPVQEWDVDESPTIEWFVDIPHDPTTYRLAYSLNGEDDFIEIDQLDGDTFEYEWVVPNIVCKPTCALQVWQENDQYTDYYSCANFVVLGGTGEEGESEAEAEGEAEAEAEAEAEGEGDGDSGGGGCAIGHRPAGPTGAAMPWILLGAAVALLAGRSLRRARAKSRR